MHLIVAPGSLPLTHNAQHSTSTLSMVEAIVVYCG